VDLAEYRRRRVPESGRPQETAAPGVHLRAGIIGRAEVESLAPRGEAEAESVGQPHRGFERCAPCNGEAVLAVDAPGLAQGGRYFFPGLTEPRLFSVSRIWPASAALGSIAR